jgi:Flp pilus assembly protein TadG
MTPTRGNRRASRRLVRGQSLVELSLVAPLLVVMLLGAAQVGSLAFGYVSIDSAAREGARAGVLAPNCSLKTGMSTGCTTSGTQWYIPGNTSHQCTAADSTAGVTGNPVCVAAVNASGTLSKSVFLTNPCASSSQGCVTITVIGPSQLQSLEVNPPKERLEGSSCNNSGATISGQVTGMPGGSTATVTDSTGDSGPTDSSGNYSICAAANGQNNTQTLTAQVGPVGCGGYSGSIGPIDVSGGNTYPNEDIPVNAYSCPTPTPLPTPTPTPTPIPTAGPTPIPGSTPFPFVAPTPGCGPETASDTYYLQITVSYPSPIFVPFIGGVFQTQPGVRLISTTVTEAIEPCTLTQGA